MNTAKMIERSGSKSTLPSFWSRFKDFILHILGQVRVYKRLYPGIMHGLIFWGATLLVLGHLISLMQMQLFIPLVELSFPRGAMYLLSELIGDIAGAILLAGLLMAAFRRLVIRPKYLTSQWDDYYAIILLSLIAILGYINEGVRITTTSPAWSNWTPIGNLFSKLFITLGLTASQGASIHTTIVWIHMTISLIFVISIPYTKLRHLIYSPLNILINPKHKEGTLPPIEDIDNAELLGVGKIEEFTQQQLISFDACVQCGRCEDLCPVAGSGIDFSPKKFVKSLRETFQNTLIAPNGHDKPAAFLSNESVWACTTCGVCLTNCPTFVDSVTPVIDLRRYQVLTKGEMPKSVGETLRNMERRGNPWGIPQQDRLNWAADLDIRLARPGEHVEVLLFLGCSASFDDRNKKVARAMVQLLNQHQVDFAILGLDEACCGETARRLGHEYLFQVMAQDNIDLLSRFSFDQIVTQCPHCMNTIRNEYAQFGGYFKVQHITEYLNMLEMTCSPNQNGHKKTITFHDPCYLGRYAGVYDAPRALLENISQNLVELPRAKETSFCCGGGGGQMWLETDADTRVNNQRLTQIQAIQADVVATACPYCLTMLEDSVRLNGLGDKIQVKDITEILMEGYDDQPAKWQIEEGLIEKGVVA